MSTRISNASLLSDRQIAMMAPADRKALGVLTPEDRRHKIEEIAEKELQRLCEQELSRRFITYLHLSFRAREKKGWPDLAFVLPTEWGEPGIPWAVELKTASGIVSKDQKTMLHDMELNGWQVRVIHSFEDFRKILEVGNFEVT